MSDSANRRFPMRKADGFVPSVQRYSAVHPDEAEQITVMYLGVQNSDQNNTVFAKFREDVQRLLANEFSPVLYDCAKYIDPDGYTTEFVVAYWYQRNRFIAWRDSDQVNGWWQSIDSLSPTSGYFREVFNSSIDHTETVAFKNYTRGLSACPMSPVEPVGESGYWGAARDRIPASAENEFKTSCTEPLVLNVDHQLNNNKRIKLEPPTNMVLVRSGVSWDNCGEEQLSSYLTNLKPVLDEGMEYLRQNPIETGCCCMRQVELVTRTDQPTKENYCAGYFLSLDHLEAWAHKHPTHLAIYGRAQQERKKYESNPELVTCHEVFVIDQGGEFEYINCHPKTGLLPYRSNWPCSD